MDNKKQIYFTCAFIFLTVLVSSQGLTTNLSTSVSNKSVSSSLISILRDKGDEGFYVPSNKIENYSIGDLDWLVGSYSTQNETLTYLGCDYFTYAINPVDLYVEEVIGSNYDPYGKSYVSYGALTVLPVVDGFVNLSLEGRAQANHTSVVHFYIRIYDYSTMNLINHSYSDPSHIGGLNVTGLLDTGFVELNCSVPLSDVNEVGVYFCYFDKWVTNWHQRIDMRNMNAAVPTDWIQPEMPSRLYDKYEDDDTFLTATTAYMNTTYDMYAFDDDYFTINLTRDHMIDVEIMHDTTLGDLDVFLCDWSGEVIIDYYTYFDRFQFWCTYEGTYYIVASFYDGLPGLFYQLNVSVYIWEDMDDIYEDNEYVEDASPLPDDTGVWDLEYYDRDIYELSLSFGYTYTFILDGDTYIYEQAFDEDVDLDMYLLHETFDGDEEDILFIANSYTSYEIEEHTTTYQGIYYLLITRYIEDYETYTDKVILPFVPYTLTISSTPSETEKTNLIFSVISLPIIALTIVKKYRRKRK